MIYLLDNNVVSEIWKPRPDARVERWLEFENWLLPVPVIAELQEGAEAAPSQVRKLELNRKLDEIIQRFSDQILEWDAETARIWGRLKHSPEVKRQPQPLWDSLIDALAVQHGMTIATRNKKDFRHAQTFNPWTDSK
jgi:predicted nucleic acid-binding protein